MAALIARPLLRLCALLLPVSLALVVLAGAAGAVSPSYELALSRIKANWLTELILLDIERGLVARWTVPGQSFVAQWSPDGARLALNQFTPPPPWPGEAVVIWERGRLSQPPDLQLPDFRWSPDGQQMALVMSVNANFDLYLADADGTNRRRLMTTPDDESAPRWSPDGRWLTYEGVDPFFVARRVYLYDLTTGDSRPLADGFRTVAPVAWSPDSTRIAYMQLVDDLIRVYVQDAATGQARPLLPTLRGEQTYPTWSPDGTQIALLVNGLPHLAEVASGALTPLPDLTRFYAGQVLWSPDGERMAVVEGRLAIRVHLADAAGRFTERFSGRLYYPPVWRPR